jgi:ferritin-like metal-binding protein YciE
VVASRQASSSKDAWPEFSGPAHIVLNHGTVIFASRGKRADGAGRARPQCGKSDRPRRGDGAGRVPSHVAARPHYQEQDMAKKAYDSTQLNELLYQALETEIGGIQVYENAIECAVNDDLRKEFSEYLEQTKNHRTILLSVFESLGLDPTTQSPGREVVAHLGASLVQAMQMAKQSGDPVGAELTACECVVLAETKDHMNWELIGQIAKNGGGDETDVLLQAYEQIESQEDQHLYHSKGWTRELWIDSLGMPAVLPPPEEIRNVESAIAASRAEQSRGDMLNERH